MKAAKAWAATIGAVATAIIGIVGGDNTVGQVLTIVAAVATAVAVYGVPNDTTPRAGDGQ